MENTYSLVWHPVDGEIKPKEGGKYFVTIYEQYFSTNRVVTIGSYLRSPFSKNYEWTHDDRMIAFAELPEPYKH